MGGVTDVRQFLPRRSSLLGTISRVVSETLRLLGFFISAVAWPSFNANFGIARCEFRFAIYRLVGLCCSRCVSGLG